MSAGDKQGTLGGALLGLVAAGLGVATAFGVHITTQEHAAVLTFCGAVSIVAPLVGALFDHSNRQAAARQVPPLRDTQGALLQARIDELTAQKESLGR